jgi:hypothetical protein
MVVWLTGDTEATMFLSEVSEAIDEVVMSLSERGAAGVDTRMKVVWVS